MAGILDLENEKKFIKNKEHLSKEDYERLGEIETELKKLGKEIRDAFKKEKYVSYNDVGKWIPVSERLPEDGQVCLVTTKGFLDNTCCEITTYSNNLYEIDRFDFYDKKNVSGFYNYDSECGFYEDADVIAWMPLPKPYSESEVK